jgi:hypothetical protein
LPPKVTQYPGPNQPADGTALTAFFLRIVGKIGQSHYFYWMPLKKAWKLVKMLLQLVPFILLVIKLSETWQELITNNDVPQPSLYLTTGLIIFNAVVYFVRFTYGVLLTGLILFLALPNAIPFSVGTSVSWITIFGIETPKYQSGILLVAIVYIIVNIGPFMNWYILRKYTKENKA